MSTDKVFGDGDSRDWTPADDLALATAASHCHELLHAFRTIKFSKEFTYEEVVERWRHLVLNEKLSGSSQKKIAALSMEEILAIQAETPFTRKEEALIHDLSLTDSPNLANMEMLLKKHPNVFHPARTARTLLDHWRKMVGNKKDRHGCQMKETNTSKEDVREKPAEKTEEPAVVQQVFERPRAKLQGRFCCFEIYRDEMMIGRSVDETEVDVELAMEDPEEDIWGIQAIVAFLPNTGKFQITNVGVKGQAYGYIVFLVRVIVSNHTCQFYEYCIDFNVFVLLSKIKFSVRSLVCIVPNVHFPHMTNFD
ncbi:unnamed protein product [Nippostrongylus brasiliensis]|uniref:Microspherule protein 1 (inferred by orthology to a human protein) n=1 Tax=Nippostrongylus brasiliensis TaxID=27835 RepID=A0A0N4YSC6_NIPBR|nr:unnamed protein product [Nippostrongylus brasiliensis]